MAITPTGSIFKGLEFDGVSSRTYGVYISGDAAYNSPERDVEMIDIPGRNGSYALDKGRFQNITVTYPAGLFDDTESDFADNLSAFRNQLASRKGYKVLTDEYNTDEYRLAVYRSGLDVAPEQLKAGQFDIVFDCMPQRWLDSGKAATTLASGGSITNPTLFPASPVLEFEGYGKINIGGETIEIHNEPYGTVAISASQTRSGAQALDDSNLDLMNNGDTITVDAGGAFTFKFAKASGTTYTSATATLSGGLSGTVTPSVTSNSASIAAAFDSVTFSKGTTATKNISIGVTIGYTYNGTPGTYTGTLSYTFKYDASAKTMQFAYTGASPSLPGALNLVQPVAWNYSTVTGYSTKTITSDTIFIDLEIGEAFTSGVSLPVYLPFDLGVGDSATSVNNIVTLPADLPVLDPGANTITYDNTITNFAITPRWWKV